MLDSLSTTINPGVCPSRDEMPCRPLLSAVHVSELEGMPDLKLRSLNGCRTLFSARLVIKCLAVLTYSLPLMPSHTFTCEHSVKCSHPHCQQQQWATNLAVRSSTCRTSASTMGSIATLFFCSHCKQLENHPLKPS